MYYRSFNYAIAVRFAVSLYIFVSLNVVFICYAGRITTSLLRLLSKGFLFSLHVFGLSKIEPIDYICLYSICFF